jgi:hypothetical protein
MRLWIDAVGIVGPGLADWQSSRPLLAGEAGYRSGEAELPVLALLPPVERRRTGTLVKLAIGAGQDALGGSREAASALPTVFASSGSDGDVIHDICATLASADRQVSPTRFHNSVHNAPAGYWSIATGSRAPSTSLCAHDWSFAAGLLEAAAQLACGCPRLLVIAADMPYPEPLRGARRVKLPFATALLLSADKSGRSLASAEVRLEDRGMAPSRMEDAGLEELRTDNPAARSLPLLALLAASRAGDVVLDYVRGQSLCLSVKPC